MDNVLENIIYVDEKAKNKNSMYQVSLSLITIDILK
ncbi:hypothetical protein J2Y60_000462 [Arcicella sp. BE140]|nr:hypothetical protein [Arcicella sp. BE51]MDR6810281.1 hypothetical protein [Arcicella sp. BE140]MDR6821631.1 hypothetical protein [Arcicella sp. BE139]